MAVEHCIKSAIYISHIKCNLENLDIAASHITVAAYYVTAGGI